jgi:hypothetical protein
MWSRIIPCVFILYSLSAHMNFNSLSSYNVGENGALEIKRDKSLFKEKHLRNWEHEIY